MDQRLQFAIEDKERQCKKRDLCIRMFRKEISELITAHRNRLAQIDACIAEDDEIIKSY